MNKKHLLVDQTQRKEGKQKHEKVLLSKKSLYWLVFSDKQKKFTNVKVSRIEERNNSYRKKTVKILQK